MDRCCWGAALGERATDARFYLHDHAHNHAEDHAKARVSGLSPLNSRRVLVIAAGENGDGHSAPRELLRRLRERPVSERWWLSLLGDSQFQIEHAMDLQISDLAVFVGTGETNGASFSFRQLAKPTGYRISTTSVDLTPSDVMHALATVGRREVLPGCYELTLDANTVDSTADGDAGNASHGLHAALAFLEQLLEEPDPAHWEHLSSH